MLKNIVICFDLQLFQFHFPFKLIENDRVNWIVHRFWCTHAHPISNLKNPSNLERKKNLIQRKLPVIFWAANNIYIYCGKLAWKNAQQDGQRFQVLSKSCASCMPHDPWRTHFIGLNKGNKRQILHYNDPDGGHNTKLTQALNSVTHGRNDDSNKR